jgi:hypothetical protein
MEITIMDELLHLIATAPHAFSDDVFLPCPMRQIADLLNEVVAETRPYVVNQNTKAA